MRKDKRLNGDLDWLPMLTSIMFLKFLEYLEPQREARQNSPGRNSSLPSKRRIADAIGSRNPTPSPATSPDGKCGADTFRWVIVCALVNRECEISRPGRG
ncbi:MAG: hypothetical protein L0Y58_16530 [Verrucomicrobia subdivision 3 bacterium]|nr:hypothetical protein [Limisphaerales bacterium]